MRVCWLPVAVLTLGLLAGGFSLSAQGLPTPVPPPSLTMLVGEAQTVQIPTRDDAVVIALVVDEPQRVNIIVQAAERDGTNPQFLLLNSFGREIISVDDNLVAQASVNIEDAVFENLFLIPDTYTLIVQRSFMSPDAGGGTMQVRVETAAAGFLSQGRVDILAGYLLAGQVYRLPITLQQNTYLSVSALSTDGLADLQLIISNMTGDILFANDDNETNDLLLDLVDPKIQQVVIPANDTYLIDLLGYSPDEEGAFKLIIERIGMLDVSTAGVQVMTGESLLLGRNTFTFEAQAGELVTITARAVQGSNFDAELQLLDPDLIFLAVNDDHDSDAPDLASFDARVSNLLLPKSGAYTLDVNSVGGRGAFEVVIERFGRLIPGGDFERIDPAGLQQINP